MIYLRYRIFFSSKFTVHNWLITSQNNSISNNFLDFLRKNTTKTKRNFSIEMAGEKQEQQQKKQNELRKNMTMLGRAIVTVENARDEPVENGQHQSPVWFNDISQRFENTNDRHANAYIQGLLSEVKVDNEKARMEDKQRISALQKELKWVKHMQDKAEKRDKTRIMALQREVRALKRMQAKGEADKKEHQLLMKEMLAKGEAEKKEHQLLMKEMQAKGEADKKEHQLLIEEMMAKSEAEKKEHQLLMKEMQAKSESEKKRILALSAFILLFIGLLFIAAMIWKQ